MNKLSLDEYTLLTKDAEVLTEDYHGAKVLRLHNGHLLKLFRLKSWWSSALFFNYAKRFYLNAKKLLGKHIITVDIQSYINIPAIKRTGVIYKPLSGANIRDIATRHQHKLSESLIKQIGSFIAHLHNEGIYFRSLHLGNIVLTNENELGIIDIADLQIKKTALSSTWRLRNMKHIKRYGSDIALLECGQNNVFVEAYVASAKPELTAKEVEQLKLLLGM